MPDKDVIDYEALQDDWLEKELGSCDSTYCIVAGHHPMFSIGTHGPTKKLNKKLKPLLEDARGMIGLTPI